ncbi:thioredoxin [Mucilaginibacter sp. RS28]|uniref:Thioredoxin n=1 Tax=Mucilaginibacter straminoryzae TaxID=2932774 RepID=A0A9X1X2V6_9SPHI|nr:thioredoxin domain-containing protein [Mucilaginibacter straminoryzae]MCJ8208528.1 thioredoxin [Mucilaginibacter straminoryzae]
MNNIARYKGGIFILLAFFALSFCSFGPGSKTVKGPDSQINFIENSWKEAVKQATAKHKYIFVDAYATWCGPCKMLKATTFKNNKAAAFFNANFVNVAIDMERGEGPALSSAWNIQAYPTLIICTPDGKPVYGTVGYIGASDLIKFGQQGLTKR